MKVTFAMPGLSLKNMIFATILLTMVVLAITYYAFQGSQSRYEIVVGSATTLYIAGLTQRLLDGFNANLGYNIEFKYVVRGSGDLLRLLADGSICLAFTHSPLLEKRYVMEGKVNWHGPFAYNMFVLAGPPSDPAGVSTASNVIEAFKMIFEAGERGIAVFVSRGDLSGTHVRELQLWSLAGLNPEGRRWYLKTSQGAPETLITASNLKAYTFVDEATFKRLKLMGRIEHIEVLFKEDTILLVNVYSLVTSRHERCNVEPLRGLLESVVEYVLGKGQSIIEGEFGVKGEFHPTKDKMDVVVKAWEYLSDIEVKSGG